MFIIFKGEVLILQEEQIIKSALAIKVLNNWKAKVQMIELMKL